MESFSLPEAKFGSVESFSLPEAKFGVNWHPCVSRAAADAAQTAAENRVSFTTCAAM